MSITATINISGSKTGDPISNDVIGPFTLTNLNATRGKTTQAFTAATFAAVVFPALQGSEVINGVIVVPPPANSGTITEKGVTGDTGIPRSKTQPYMLTFDGITASNFGLLCGSNTVMEFIWF